MRFRVQVWCFLFQGIALCRFFASAGDWYQPRFHFYVKYEISWFVLPLTFRKYWNIPGSPFLFSACICGFISRSSNGFFIPGYPFPKVRTFIWCVKSSLLSLKGCRSCTCIIPLWNDLPTAKWKFPATLFTLRDPHIRQPSPSWSRISLTETDSWHCLISDRASRDHEFLSYNLRTLNMHTVRCDHRYIAELCIVD